MEHPKITLKYCKNLKLLPSLPKELWIKIKTDSCIHTCTFSLSFSLVSLLPALPKTYGSAVEKYLLVVRMKE
jgi:hypothetical protein